jgi:hypothetical protein
MSVVFSGYSGLSTNKTDGHDIVEILLKVALNTMNQTSTADNLYLIVLFLVLKTSDI